MMDRDFIKRSLRVSIIVTIILVPLISVYFSGSVTLGFMAGSAWNIFNLFLLTKLLNMFIMPHEVKKKWGITAGIIKFPVLYGIGYSIIRYTDISRYGIMCGISVVLIVIMLKALGIYYTNVFLQGKRNYGRSA